MEWIFLLLLTGLGAGIIGALVGLGGGVIIVPALLYFHYSLGYLEGLTPQTAVGVSTVVMIATGLSSTIAYTKKKTVDYKTGFIFFMGSGPGGIIGSYANKTLELNDFNLYFGSFVIVISIILFVKDYLKPLNLIEHAKVKKTFVDQTGKEYTYGYQPWLVLLIAFAIGFCSGLFGIGGGSLIVPAMILLFLFPPHVAVATSMFIVFLSSFTNSLTHIYLGNVIWPYALVLIPAAWIGAKTGAAINSKLQSKTVVSILRLVLLGIGLKLVFEGITG